MAYAILFRNPLTDSLERDFTTFKHESSYFTLKTHLKYDQTIINISENIWDSDECTLLTRDRRKMSSRERVKSCRNYIILYTVDIASRR